MKKPTKTTSPRSKWRIYIPIYDIDLSVHYSNDKTLVDRLIGHYDAESQGNDHLDSASVIIANDKKRAVLVLNPDKFSMHVLVHECDHLSHQIMRCIGVKECEDSEEAYTYLTEFIFAMVHSKLQASGIIL